MERVNQQLLTLSLQLFQKHQAAFSSSTNKLTRALCKFSLMLESALSIIQSTKT
jgi:hypothetical protein